jgi:hypothetical protein
MQRAWIAFVLLGLSSYLCAQTAQTPEQVALIRAKEKVLASLDAIPNYTCLQTIERVQLKGEPGRQPDGSPLPLDALLERADSSDTLRVEVGFAGNKEFYSWPGEGSFEEKSLLKMVGFGFISSGTFATALRNAFLGSTELFRAAGEEDLNGRRVLRYDYLAKGAGRALLLADRNPRTEVPYEGSVWIDAVTFDILRLRIKAEALSVPDISEIWGQLDYAVTNIGSGAFLLPQSAHMMVRLPAGVQRHNRSVFSGCRLFGVSSELSFDDGPAAITPASARTEKLELPADAILRVKFGTRIDSEKSSVGDKIEGQLERAVKKGGQLVVPKGAIVTGRIRRLDRFRKPARHVLGLEITELRFENRVARIQATLRQVSPIPGQTSGETRNLNQTAGMITQFPHGQNQTQIFTDPNLPGIGMIPIDAGKFKIRPGWKTIWKVEVAE